MIPKGEVNYITVKERKNSCIALVICLTLISCIGISVIVKLFVDCYSLTMENQYLTSLIETQTSMIADLQEDNMKLQEMMDNVKNKK